MAVDGVSGEVLYPSFAMNLFGLQDAALQEACFRVYNNWILEYCSVAPDRLYGVSCIPTYDINHGVAELERCRKAVLLGALVWQAPPPELSFATNHYERLWAAAQDLEVPISLHILTGQPFPWPRPMGLGGQRQAFETMRSAVNKTALRLQRHVRPDYDGRAGALSPAQIRAGGERSELDSLLPDAVRQVLGSGKSGFIAHHVSQ
jgi:hypothetical protein